MATSNGQSRGRQPRQRPTRVDDSIFETLSVMYRDTAGIDIGANTHYVSVPEDRCEQSVRTFGCFTPDIEAMAQWLKECRIHHVVMESTGVYWMSSYQILTEMGFDVRLVDARHAKGVPGRKTDVWDCRWLRKLHTFGLLRGCFLPPKEVEEMRTYWRHRANLVTLAGQQTQRMHKSLEMMNVQLHKVLSDTNGRTGMAIIRQIVAGERDPANLAQHRHGNLKHSEETFIKALTGFYQPEHLFTLKQAVDCFDFLQRQIEECDQQLQKCMAAVADKEPTDPGDSGQDPPEEGKSRAHRPSKNEPEFDLHSELVRIAGVDLTLIDGINTMTFQTIVSECGPSLARSFPTEKHFSSWIGLCPNNQITGGRVRSKRTRKVKNRVAQAFRMAAESLHHSNSALGAFYRRQKARLGAPKANTVTAHKLARLVWRMLTYGKAYIDIGQAAYEKQTAERTLKFIQRKAIELGYSLVQAAPIPVPA
jgi:transposase